MPSASSPIPQAASAPSSGTHGPTDGSAFEASARSEDRGEELDHSEAAIPVTSADPTWGDPWAPVTLVEFSDFQCPFCARAENTLEALRREYGAQQLRIVWKNYPLSIHPYARAAHDAAMAVFTEAGNQAFWKFQAIAFRSQERAHLASENALTDSNFEEWAKQVGADEAEFRVALSSSGVSTKIDEDLALGAKLSIQGTPNFRINGIEISGAQPLEKFKAVIDEELSASRKLVASGTSAGQVYVQRVKSNLESAASKAAESSPPEDSKIWKASIASSDPTRGSADALVTIVEYGDFQCPFCKRASSTVATLLEEYKGDLRLVWKDNALPFHPRAIPAAALAQVAFDQNGAEGFWRAHDALFAMQPKLEDSDLEQVAAKLGLNWMTVKHAVAKGKYSAKFENSANQAEDLNAAGVPHFFVNGYRVSGAQPLEKFKVVIDRQLELAKAMVARGTPRANVYAEIMATAYAGAPPEQKDVPAPGKNSPVRGASTAKVIIQQWGDFECPFCARMQSTLAELEIKYKGKIKIVWRDLPLPFHPHARLAAEAAREAYAQKGNAGFWKFHSALFAGKQQAGKLDRAELEQLAQDQGLNLAKFKAALDAHTHHREVEADEAIAKERGISGTPTTFAGKYVISGARSRRAFQKIIELALKDAG